MSIADNVKRIRERAAQAAIRSGRRPEDIALVAASKMNGAERVREAYDAGIRIFGENRVQEMLEKLSKGAYEGAELHLIGSLQKNKVRNVVGRVSLIQSVDSLGLMEEISRRAATAGIVQDVLIEVNVGREPSKSGVFEETLADMLAQTAAYPGIRVMGLMAIPPAEDDAAEARKYFDTMEKLFVDMSVKKYDNVFMSILSMGMSGDFEEAIAAGATMVRVGSSIFGARDYPAR